MAQIHLISGKGGVGKTTLSAALAKSLDKSRSGPILLIDVESGGELSKIFSQSQKGYIPQKILHSHNIWVSTLTGEECFKEYFSKLFQKNHTNIFQGAFKSFSQKVVQKVTENKVVKSFIDVCPGLKPIVILGKICWEAENGHPPELTTPWAHVIVDAPTTGYVKMLFKSMQALEKAFPIGKIHEQAKSTLKLVRSPDKLSLGIVTLLEELPLTESKELHQDMLDLGIQTQKIFYNKAPFLSQKNTIDFSAIQDEQLSEFLLSETEILEEKKRLLEKSINSTIFKNCQKFLIPSQYLANSKDQVEHIAQEISSQERL